MHACMHVCMLVCVHVCVWLYVDMFSKKTKHFFLELVFTHLNVPCVCFAEVNQSDLTATPLTERNCSVRRNVSSLLDVT